jgi:hypothetical protein
MTCGNLIRLCPRVLPNLVYSNYLLALLHQASQKTRGPAFTVADDTLQLRTWSASVIFRLSRGRTVRPAHHLSVRGALGARQTLAAGVVHEQKKSAAAAPANPVPRRRARSGFRSSWSAEAAFRALSPAGREFREVSLGARLADCVAVVTAGLGRPFPHLAGVARDAVSSFFHRPVSVEPGRTYVSSSQHTECSEEQQ